MEMICLTDSIFEFLILSSALLFILGLLSSVVLRVLKIHGKPRLWICALLVVMPLAYPIKSLVPEPVKIPIDLKTYQTFDLQRFETISVKNSVSKGEPFPTKDGTSADQTWGKEKILIEREISSTNSTNRPMETVYKFPFDWKLMATLLWILIFFYLLIRLGVMVYNTNWFLRLADTVTNTEILKLLNQCADETGLRRTPRLLTVDRIAAPMVMGFFKPAILLPNHLLESEFREGLRFTLLHELEHMRRHHNWWLLIESIIGAAYFFHPFIHWAKRRIHEELEHICDNHVIHITKKSVSYADFLLHEIRQQAYARDPVLALPFIYGVKKTTKRIRSILKNTRPTLFSQVRGKFAVGLILLSFVSLLLCGVAPSDRETEQTLQKMNPTTADSQERDNNLTPTAVIEKETPKVFKPEEITPEEKPIDLPEGPLSLNNTVEPLKLTTTSDKHESTKEDINATLEKKPISDSKNPAVVMAYAGVQAEKTPEQQTESAAKIPSNAPTVHKAKAMEFYGEDSLFFIKRGDSYYRKGQFENAVSDYSAAIDLNPEDAAIYYFRGSTYSKTGQIDKAISDYNRAIEIDPEYSYAYINRGHIHFSRGEYDKAISDYSRVLDISPGYTAAYVNRGHVYYSIGNYNKAISDYNKAIDLNPEDAVTYYFRGSTYFKTGQIDKAVSDYTRALEINPEYTDAYINRGHVYYSGGQYGKAISDYTRAIEIDPGNTDAYIKRGDVYRSYGYYYNAISDYTKAMVINPGDSVAMRKASYALLNIEKIAYYRTKTEEQRYYDFLQVAQQARAKAEEKTSEK